MRTSDTVELARRLGLTSIDDLAKVERLQKIARRLHILAEIECNRDFTPREEREQARLEAEAEAMMLACPNVRAVEHDRDPRGLPLYFAPKEGHGPTWHSININGVEFSAHGVYGGW